MKAIWDKGEDISIPELTEVLKTKYHKDYKRTTIVTFILNLSAKGFARQYRVGRYAYVHALKSEEEYKQKLLNDYMDFWYQGDAVKVMASLVNSKDISSETAQKMRRMLDGLDGSARMDELDG
ncbi:MAG: BlaI/MecI/CopY family transcriptional regulator [Dorea sp.]|nr:BlaI/MecI/CopY family transcriptional regulator [Dorea sp.]